jgi:hypothetical protein
VRLATPDPVVATAVHDVPDVLAVDVLRYRPFEYERKTDPAGAENAGTPVPPEIDAVPNAVL